MNTIIFNMSKKVRTNEFDFAAEWYEGSKVSGFLWRKLAGDWKGDRVAVVGPDVWNTFKEILAEDGITSDPWEAECIEIDEGELPKERYAICNSDYVERGEGQILSITTKEDEIEIRRQSDLIMMLSTCVDAYHPGDYSEELVGVWAFCPIEMTEELENEDVLKNGTGVFCSYGYPTEYISDEDIRRIIRTSDRKVDTSIPMDGMDFYALFLREEDDDEEYEEE